MLSTLQGQKYDQSSVVDHLKPFLPALEGIEWCCQPFGPVLSAIGMNLLVLSTLQRQKYCILTSVLEGN